MKLKSFLFKLCLLFIIASSTEAQTTWAQPGAHWYYTEGLINVPILGFGYYEIWEDGDTLVNGITCDILRSYREGILNFVPGGMPYSWPGSTWYTYQNNDTVYVFYNNTFYVLFVKNIQSGQSWISGPDESGGCPGDTITVDTVTSVTINGITTNRIVPNGPDVGAEIYFHDPIYERFGSTGFFIPAPTPLCITESFLGPLRCYNDSAGFSFITNVTPTCDYITSVSEPGPVQVFSVYPNPATNELRIYTGNKHATPEIILEVFQADGKLKEIFKISNDVKTINISTFSSGIYFIKIKDWPQMRPVRFVKL